MEDICLAGNPAINGICGDPECVCARRQRRWFDENPEPMGGVERVVWLLCVFGLVAVFGFWVLDFLRRIGG